MRDAAVALVRRDDVVGQPERAPSRAAPWPHSSGPPRAEARAEQLGHEVVVVEHEARAAQLQRQRDEEQQVGRVAGLHDVERPLAVELRGPAAATARAPCRTRAGSRRARRSRPRAGSGGSRRPRSARRARCRASRRAGRSRVTSWPASTSARLSCQTRRSKGTREVLDEDQDARHAPPLTRPRRDSRPRARPARAAARGRPAARPARPRRPRPSRARCSPARRPRRRTRRPSARRP